MSMHENQLASTIGILNNDKINFNREVLTRIYSELQKDPNAVNYSDCRILILSPNHDLISTFYIAIGSEGYANHLTEKEYSDKLFEYAITFSLVLIDDPKSGPEVIKKIKAENPDVICIGVGTQDAKAYIEAGALTVIDFDPNNRIKALQQVAEALQRKEELETFRSRFPGVLLPAERGIHTVEQYLARLKESQDPYELVLTLGIYDNYAIPVMADFTAVEGVFKSISALKTDEDVVRNEVIDDFTSTTSREHTFIMQEQEVDLAKYGLYPLITIRNDIPISQGFEPISQRELGQIKYIAGQSLVQFNAQPADIDDQFKFTDTETAKILLHAKIVALCIENLMNSNMPFYLASTSPGYLCRGAIPLGGYAGRLVYNPQRSSVF